jgi:hypothetical protein
MPRKDKSETIGVKEQRRRVEPHDKSPQVRPFVRATKLTDIALYWLPVAKYPMRAHERRWMLAFLRRLKLKLASEKKLRLETFLQFKALYPDLLNRFLSRSQDYQPMTGLLLQPGAKPPDLPALEDIEAEVKKGGPVNVNQWIADYCYWFLVKQDERQREDFLGFGGLVFLFLASDPGTKPPDLKIPKVMRTHPALKDVDVDARMAIAYSLQDKFLKQSKESFGERFREDPAYPGIPYILPLLKSEDFFNATAEQRAQWFQVFEVYCIESKPDKGVLLALKDADFDDALGELVKELCDEGIKYQA